MLFSSATFCVFLGVVFSAYWLTGRRAWRHRLLLVASAVFYGYWDYRFLALLGYVSLVAYAFAKLMVRFGRHKRALLIGAVVLELLQLAFFKYALFASSTLADVLSLFGLTLTVPPLSIVLPVGISFYTFQAVSYLIDVYRGDIDRTRGLEAVALYIAFFPQLVAGPILRADHFVQQLDEDKQLGARDLLVGLKLICIGLIYKSVLADHLAPIIDPVFASPAKYDNAALVAASVGFYSQIYFDFAGYSTMAIGLARLFGFKLPKNFDFPYRASSVTSFWRRWHISLSTWLRDYLYIPLGGNRQGKLKQYRNLMLTMLLGGLWHGASYNFVLWGGMHGVALAVHKFFSEKVVQRPLPKPLWLLFAWALTQAFILASWVPFRCPTFSDTLAFLGALTGTRASGGNSQIEFGLLLWLPVAADHLFTNNPKLRAFPWPRQPLLIAALLGACFALALTLVASETETFIYFQF